MMPHLAPTLTRVWSYENTCNKVERWGRERDEQLGMISQIYNTSLILRNQDPNIKILTRTTTWKCTRKKTKIKNPNK